MLQTQINTIPRTNIISTTKQLINAVSQFLQMCRNTRIKFLSWAYMYTTLRSLGKRVIQTNQRERERESESESEWFIEKGRGPMSIVVTNTVKQL